LNVTAVLKSSAEHGGPIALSAGVAALMVALIGAGHGSPVAAGPAPTATTTVTAPPVIERPPPWTTTVSAPAPRPVVFAAGQPISAPGAPRPGGGAPSGPSPTSQPPATSRCGVGLTVLALNACLSIGGNP
jgi:hypothetical protein